MPESLAKLTHSWQCHRELLIPAWCMALVVCVLAAQLGDGLYYFIDFRENGRRFAGLMSLASGFCLMGLAWSLLVVARRERSCQAATRQVWGWLLGAVFACLLAFDEVAQLHEALTHALQRAGVPKLFGVLDQDLYIFAAYAGVVGVVWVLIRGAWISNGRLLFPALAAVGFLAGSQMVDLIPWDSMTHSTQQVVGATEEVLKTMGTFTLALLGLLLVSDERS